MGIWEGSGENVMVAVVGTLPFALARVLLSFGSNQMDLEKNTKPRSRISAYGAYVAGLQHLTPLNRAHDGGLGETHLGGTERAGVVRIATRCRAENAAASWCVFYRFTTCREIYLMLSPICEGRDHPRSQLGCR